MPSSRRRGLPDPMNTTSSKPCNGCSLEGTSPRGLAPLVSVGSPWLTLPEAAAYVRRSLSYWRALATAGKTPGIKQGGTWLFHREALDRYLQRGGVMSKPRSNGRSGRPPSRAALPAPVPEKEAPPQDRHPAGAR
jgi:excisionase family DNA binding protein